MRLEDLELVLLTDQMSGHCAGSRLGVVHKMRLL